MKILEYNDIYMNDIKDLLCELQEHIVILDEYKIQIMADNYREDYFNDMMEKIKNNNGMIYVAIEDDIVLGFIAGIIEVVEGVDALTVGEFKLGRIIELCVTNKLRSKGIGSELVNKVEDYLKNKECDYIYVDVFGPNTKAIDFYNKNGYNLRNIEVMKKVN